MQARERPRPAWAELPAGLRSRIEEALDAAVTVAESRPGGWSPGSADRVLLADGRRAFVKTASADVNAVTVRLHRREAEVLRMLHGAGTAPGLLAVVDEPPWFAVLVEDVDGRHPDPRGVGDTVAVLDAVGRLPAAIPGLAALEEDLAPFAEAWTRLAEDGLAMLPEVARQPLPILDRLARRAPELLAGDSVVHGDLRLDNVLIDAAGRARIIDWPSAARGVRWFDGVTYLLDVRGQGGDPLPHLDHPVFAEASRQGIDALLALLAGYFFDSARRPPVPGLEGIRGFQRFQGEVVLDWLQERGVLVST